MRLLAPLGLVAALVIPIGYVPAARADDVCLPGENQHVWFLGAVYDPEQREDFKIDVDNFEYFLAKLREIYCIPDSQQAILAFENNFQRNGKTYPTASEGAVKARLAAMGAAASQFDDSILFYFQSSHGLVYAAASCTGGTRLYGSFAALKSSGGNDGNFNDCELGKALNDNFASDVGMAIFVDCSFCGGFSDSLTPVSGTVPDAVALVSSGVPKANRIVMTGCAMTTECFGGSEGSVSFGHMKFVMEQTVFYADRMTTPGFPLVQGINAPARIGTADARVGVSEWVFAAVNSAYMGLDVIGIQEQFRLKYGFATLEEDILVR